MQKLFNWDDFSKDATVTHTDEFRGNGLITAKKKGRIEPVKSIINHIKPNSNELRNYRKVSR